MILSISSLAYMFASVYFFCLWRNVGPAGGQYSVTMVRRYVDNFSSVIFGIVVALRIGD